MRNAQNAVISIKQFQFFPGKTTTEFHSVVESFGRLDLQVRPMYKKFLGPLLKLDLS